MKHLVIGASGQVGQLIMSAVRAQGDDVVGTYWQRPSAGLVGLDMRDRQALHRLMAEVAPAVVWVPGAMADVDQCERLPAVSHAVNVVGPIGVMEEASQRHVPLVFFSTDYVFDGRRGPYDESDEPCPLQVYGRHKWEAERALLQYERTLIIRPAWIYSDDPHPRNFVYRVLKDLKAGRTIPAAIDQLNTPTPAQGLARQSLKAVREGMTGILHLTGPERVSRYALVSEIARLAGYPEAPITPIRLQDLPLAAPRPLNGGLVTQFAEFAIQDPLRALEVRKLLTAI
ncbi:MAG: SDR family oxidoreductase [Firmicutes bacterium]|nr:SDR family oxidoreductase [Bacillota bacterium]